MLDRGYKEDTSGVQDLATAGSPVATGSQARDPAHVEGTKGLLRFMRLVKAYGLRRLDQ